MSYARFSETSDVYVFAHVDGFVACCGCLLTSIVDLDHGSVALHSAAEAVAHMRKHEAAGYMVPDSVLDPATYDDSDFTVPSGDGS